MHELNEVQKRRSTDFEALKLISALSGSCLFFVETQPLELKNRRRKEAKKNICGGESGFGCNLSPKKFVVAAEVA